MEGGLAIASLSIQLIDSISAIKTFIQNVKDAPKESQRIVDLLERLGDLIEGVRDMTEQQTMLRGHQLPAPSPIIFRCLKSCETTLQPLQDLADKYQRSQAQKSSPITKLKGDLKLAWKAKDIVAMETRIQQEIQYLTSTLVLNSTSILFQVPAMFNAHRQVEPQALAISTCEEVVEKTSLISSSDDIRSFGRAAVTASRSLEKTTMTASRSLERTAITTTTRSSWVPSYFERFGLRQQKLLRILSIAEDQSSTDTNEQVISEQDVYTWAFSYLGHGISLTRNRVYGGILPSITTYPIVERFDMEFGYFSVGEFQRKITSGEIHPYTRDEAGRSLLHEAAYHHRLDLCKLLLSYGLQPDLSRGGQSPFYDSLFTWGHVDRTELFRLFVQEANDFKTLGLVRWFPMSGELLYNQKMEEAIWLWAESTNFFYGEDLAMFRNLLYQQTVYYYIVLLTDPRLGELSTFPDVFKIPELRECFESGKWNFLSKLFENGADPIESFSIGRSFLDFLEELGVDVRKSITAEMRELTNEYTLDAWDGIKRILFDASDTSDSRRWTLGWEWATTPEDLGYLLFTEYTDLSVARDEIHWPYYDYKPGEYWPLDLRNLADRKKETRFNRRAEKKAHKERARLGIKQPKTRMPGSWS